MTDNRIVRDPSLKEGDTIASRVSDRTLRDVPMTREEALERIKALQRPLPEDWKFDRDEANAR